MNFLSAYVQLRAYIEIYLIMWSPAWADLHSIFSDPASLVACCLVLIFVLSILQLLGHIDLYIMSAPRRLPYVGDVVLETLGVRLVMYSVGFCIILARVWPYYNATDLTQFVVPYAHIWTHQTLRGLPNPAFLIWHLCARTDFTDPTVWVDPTLDGPPFLFEVSLKLHNLISRYTTLGGFRGFRAFWLASATIDIFHLFSAPWGLPIILFKVPILWGYLHLFHYDASDLIVISLTILFFFAGSKIIRTAKDLAFQTKDVIVSIATATGRAFAADGYRRVFGIVWYVKYALTYYLVHQEDPTVFGGYPYLRRGFPLVVAVALPVLTFEYNRRIPDRNELQHTFAFLYAVYLAWTLMIITGIEQPRYETEYSIIGFTILGIYWKFIPMLSFLFAYLCRQVDKRGPKAWICMNIVVPVFVSAIFPVFEAVANPIPLAMTSMDMCFKLFEYLAGNPGDNRNRDNEQSSTPQPPSSGGATDNGADRRRPNGNDNGDNNVQPANAPTAPTNADSATATPEPPSSAPASDRRKKSRDHVQSTGPVNTKPIGGLRLAPRGAGHKTRRAQQPKASTKKVTFTIPSPPPYQPPAEHVTAEPKKVLSISAKSAPCARRWTNSATSREPMKRRLQRRRRRELA
jgi:hypothetical protein